MCKILHHQSFSVWKRIPFLFNLSADGKLRNSALKVLHEETHRVIKLRRSQMELEGWKSPADLNDGEDAEEFGGAKRRVAFLDSLLLAQRETGQLTDANIQEEVDTFMFEVSVRPPKEENKITNRARFSGSRHNKFSSGICRLFAVSTRRSTAACVRRSRSMRWPRIGIDDLFRGCDQRNHSNLSACSVFQSKGCRTVYGWECPSSGRCIYIHICVYDSKE